MDDFDEDLIWDTIMESAKGKIDYKSFAALFPFSPDNFLSSIIYGFAANSSREVIVDKISAQVFMTGNLVDKASLLLFIEDNHPALKDEIAVTVRALKMLNDGIDPELVYKS